MRVITGAFLALAILCGAVSSAQAAPKTWIWGWGAGHWENQDFKPYPDHPRHPHYSQWDSSDWTPDDWIAQRGGDGMQLIRDFYKAEILTDQYDKRTVPVVEVGPGFYKLGGQDKRRVMAVIDTVYEITAQNKNGLFMLHDSYSHKAIGVYSRHGLQMQ